MLDTNTQIKVGSTTGKIDEGIRFNTLKNRFMLGPLKYPRQERSPNARHNRLWNRTIEKVPRGYNRCVLARGYFKTNLHIYCRAIVSIFSANTRSILHPSNTSQHSIHTARHSKTSPMGQRCVLSIF